MYKLRHQRRLGIPWYLSVSEVDACICMTLHQDGRRPHAREDFRNGKKGRCHEKRNLVGSRGRASVVRKVLGSMDSCSSAVGHFISNPHNRPLQLK